MKNRQSILMLSSLLFLIMAGAAFFFVHSFESDHSSLSLSSFSAPNVNAFPIGSFESAKQVFDHRCVECHSCNTAPCQLKLTSYEGLRRGLTQIQIYDPLRTSEIAPTRLGIDAHSESGWRAHGFYPVVTLASSGESSMLLNVLKTQNGPLPQANVLDQHVCPLTTSDLAQFQSQNPTASMPYGLPALSQLERESLDSWVAGGSRAPSATSQARNAVEQANLASWQYFLNPTDLRGRLVSRYLYEHLYLAHIYFDAEAAENAGQLSGQRSGLKGSNFYRLIRSRTLCGSQAQEIPTRRPTDDPGASVYYCFQPVTETIVEKTHMPYLMDAAKLARMKSIFYQEAWNLAHLPDYKNGTNPFLTFVSIPAKARYQFLLEDAHYHISTFIKGPVCNGTGAVSAIDEHFFVTFIDPSSDLQVLDRKFSYDSASVLKLPAETGGGMSLFRSFSFLEKYLKYERDYKGLKSVVRNRYFPAGYRLTDIWDGDGKNSNALLTVFRHSENAEVVKGFQGGMANSIFILDYALFERLVYDLAVDYDVFGAVSHQLYTRVYMDLIRRESEDNFLNFIPSSARESIYSRLEGFIPAGQDRALNLAPDLKFPSQIQYQGSSDYELQFISKLVNERYSPAVLGTHDFINTHYLDVKKAAPELQSLETNALSNLRQLSQVPASRAPIVSYMPDSALLIVENNEKITQVYTIIRNKAHSILGRFMGENKTRDFADDSLVFVPGLATSYPNYFYVVSAASLPAFTQGMLAVRSASAYYEFNDRWGVSRENDSFWQVSDSLHEFLRAQNPVESGYLDYSRYSAWTVPSDK